MKWLISFLLSSFVISTQTQLPSATTITIGLFTTQATHSVTIIPLGADAWQQSCATCERSVFRTPLHIDRVNRPTYFGGNLRVQSEVGGPPVEAAGLYKIVSAAGALRVTLQMPSERYVGAVLSAEAAPDEPPASLEALAIAARTFALANLRRHKAENFDLCDSTHCQALRLGLLRPAVVEAVRNTAGITLWNGQHRASIYYTQHCGGITEAASALWPTERSAYLATHSDPYCIRRSPASWQADIPLADLNQIASELHWSLPRPVTDVRIVQHTGSGRAKLLELSGPARVVTISASSLRFGINRSLGWNRIRSDLYTVVVTGNMLHFTGHGYGHGVGLCQAGAFEMAREHRTAAEILAFYFPNTHAGLISSGGLWHNETAGAVTIRAISPNPELTHAIEIAWQRALGLFPLMSDAPRPTIVVAPTTELFRQLTSSPGYLLAVTRGDQITLQPLSVLRRNGPLESVILHEFLHVLIESQSTSETPLWLREGLAEALGDIQSAYTPPSLSVIDIERALANPPDLAAYRQAHRDAAAIVRALGHTYSLSVMREWLRNGVPAQVLQSVH